MRYRKIDSYACALFIVVDRSSPFIWVARSVVRNSIPCVYNCKSAEVAVARRSRQYPSLELTMTMTPVSTTQTYVTNAAPEPILTRILITSRRRRSTTLVPTIRSPAAPSLISLPLPNHWHLANRPCHRSLPEPVSRTPQHNLRKLRFKVGTNRRRLRQALAHNKFPLLRPCKQSLQGLPIPAVLAQDRACSRQEVTPGTRGDTSSASSDV